MVRESPEELVTEGLLRSMPYSSNLNKARFFAKIRKALKIHKVALLKRSLYLQQTSRIKTAMSSSFRLQNNKASKIQMKLRIFLIQLTLLQRKLIKPNRRRLIRSIDKLLNLKTLTIFSRTQKKDIWRANSSLFKNKDHQVQISIQILFFKTA